jgi:DNA-binding CsgD family transcriptional regulator
VLGERGSISRVLVLTTYDTASDVLPSIEARRWLSPSVARRLMGQVRAPARESLSQRELEVLALISRGSTNREAASRPLISEATVKTHLVHIYTKLGVADRAAAVRTAFKQGCWRPTTVRPERVLSIVGSRAPTATWTTASG